MLEPIAIVGMAARIPGCPQLADFWNLLIRGGDVFSPPPAGLWPVAPEKIFSKQLGITDHIYQTRGAFLARSCQEALHVDPLFALAEELGAAAWADGVTTSLDRNRCGVLIGNLYLPSARQSAWARSQRRKESGPGLGDSRWNAHGPARHLARKLELGGETLTLDAACASSLYALALAMQRLRRGEVDAMLAGGLARPDTLYTQMGFCQLRALSPSGVPRPLDAQADGMLVGEGGALFLLKRLQDALDDGDFVWAVLHGAGISNDRNTSLLAPGTEGQLRAMRAAYMQAMWTPQSIDFIECHATGTPIGDRVELESLRQLFAATEATQSVVLGSVKANIGHLLTGAGAVGLVKILLAFQEKLLPPQPVFSAWNHPAADIGNTFRIASRPEAWLASKSRGRRAAISGFGFGGINAHLLVESWPPPGPAQLPSPVVLPTPVELSLEQVLYWKEGKAIPAVPPRELAIPPLEWSEMLADQQRLLLLALELLHHKDRHIDFSRTAVLLHMETAEEPLFYSYRWTLEPEARVSAGPALTPGRTLGSLASITASRIARLIGTEAPSFVLSSAGDPIQALLTAARDLHEMQNIDEVILGCIPFAQSDSLTICWNKHFKSECSLPDGGHVAVVLAKGRFSSHEAAAETTRPNLTFEQCLEFARGTAAKALGPKFAPLDAVPVRVRLPDEPLMLVHRVTAIEAEPLSLAPGRIVTEHEVHEDAWYLDGNRMPTSIAVEAGQADLLLVGYLGIDLTTQGKAVYRLLDAQIAFHRGLPQPGEKVIYDIRIERFQEYGDTHLFFFNYDATIAGQPFLTMRHGCAGFFSSAALKSGEGLVLPEVESNPDIGPWTAPSVPKMPTELQSSQLNSLRLGDLESAFGPHFAGKTLARPLRLPTGKLALIERIEAIEERGGRFGRGLIRAVLPIQPDDWHLVCHFKDDPVMPGTLMYECCLHTLRVWLLAAGMFGDAPEAKVEPVPEILSKLKCRGQVIPTTREAAFEIHLKECGYNPNVYAVADAILYADRKPIVHVANLCVQFSGVTQDVVRDFWRGDPTSNAKTLQETRNGNAADARSILEYSLGRPSVAFGPAYTRFDQDQVIARLPAPPFQFLDRIERVEGTPFRMEVGASALAAYDVPSDAWYFAAADSDTLPFAILLEAALQPCGWLAAYMGSALNSGKELSFRNLGGRAKIHRRVGRKAGTLRTLARVTQVSHSLDMIIQHFDFETTCNGETVYTGSTYFGFFTKAALAQQEGIRGVARLAIPPTAEPLEPLSRLVPGPNCDWSMLSYVQRLPHERDSIRHLGRIAVDSTKWFFAAHFYQDPVWPGSLGLEAFLQLGRAIASTRWPESRTLGYCLPEPDSTHEWVYRGQILPSQKEVSVVAQTTAIDENRKRLELAGLLFADGLPIYQMSNFVLSLTEAS